MGGAWSQLFPAKPDLVEKNLPPQKGKVFVITGGASGVGFELASILYGAGGRVYIAGRSEEYARKSIEAIQSAHPGADGDLRFLFIDLSDLSSIKPCVKTFEETETRLDVLFNNAAVSLPPLGSTSKQGYELQMATNCLGPFLLSSLLLPMLKRTAQESGPGSVRLVWTSSQVVDLSAPKGGFAMTDITTPPKDKTQNYVATKTGNWFLASEFGKLGTSADSRGADTAVLSITQNPGNLSTNLLRHAKWMKFLSAPLLHPARMGAYTELWAGFTPELRSQQGAYIVPWGNLHPAPRPDLLNALRSRDDGGTGLAKDFYDWCREQTVEYM